jgi:hypothetical protein
MSPRAAATLLTGAEPNIPPNSRVMRMAAAFLLHAVAMENTPRKNIAGRIPHRRPQISAIGAQQSGPNANPRLCHQH